MNQCILGEEEESDADEVVVFLFPSCDPACDTASKRAAGSSGLRKASKKVRLEPGLSQRHFKR